MRIKLQADRSRCKSLRNSNTVSLNILHTQPFQEVFLEPVGLNAKLMYLYAVPHQQSVYIRASVNKLVQVQGVAVKLN